MQERNEKVKFTSFQTKKFLNIDNIHDLMVKLAIMTLGFYRTPSGKKIQSFNNDKPKPNFRHGSSSVSAEEKIVLQFYAYCNDKIVKKFNI